MEEQIIVKLRSYTSRPIEEACKVIVSATERSGAKTRGPIPMPTRTHRYCVLRSPHVNKKSREHFELKVHKRCIFITSVSPQTMDLLMKVEIPAGVEVSIGE